MPSEQIRAILAAGEGLQVEFKEKYGSGVIESLVAFSNTAGGQVLIGVDNQGRVTGLADVDRVVESVLSACREAVSPSLTPDVTIVRVPEGPIVIAQVRSSDRMHAKSGAVFIRHGRQTRRATSEEIRVLSLRETPEVFEQLAATGASITSLDLAKLSDYFARTAPRASASDGGAVRLAIGAKLAVDTLGQTLPTVAGMVLFGRDPQGYNANWGITALRIRGQALDRNHIVDRRELTGTADRLIEAALRFVSDHMRIAARFDPGSSRRQDVAEYSLDAVREAVANAVAHRDYHPPETIQIRMFDDRLEIQNPGGLLPGLTIQALMQGGIARRRNEVISEVLRRLGYVEKAGFGIVFIRQQLHKIGAGTPEFVASSTHFLVTMPANKPNFAE
jgi:ATP-dependent DNA helicase RecG